VQDQLDLRVGHHAGEAVGAEQVLVAAGQVDRTDLGLHHGLDPDRA